MHDNLIIIFVIDKNGVRLKRLSKDILSNLAEKASLMLIGGNESYNL